MFAREFIRKSVHVRFWPARRSERSLCPRCHSRYEGIGCLKCGWVTDTSVACSDSESLREGRAIA